VLNAVSQAENLETGSVETLRKKKERREIAPLRERIFT
jgi:hypothetical protein